MRHLILHYKRGLVLGNFPQIQFDGKDLSIFKVGQAELLVQQAVVIQSLSCVWLFVTPWTAARQASLSPTISQSLFKLMSIESLMPSNRLIFCCPLFLLPSIFPSIRVFSNGSNLCIRWTKYWSFSISPSNEY